MRQFFLSEKMVFWWAGTLALVLTANAQPYRDEFDGGFSLPWRWRVSGNTPWNTEDPTMYDFDGGSLNIIMQPGSLGLNLNNARNIPTLRVGPASRGWYIETRVTLDLGSASGAWIQAGLIWLFDADNYYTYHLVLDPFQDKLFLGTSHESVENGAAVFRGGGFESGRWERQRNTVTLRMQDHELAPVGHYVEIWYDNGDGQGLRWGITVPTAAIAGWPFTVLRDLLLYGGRIGVYTDNSGYVGDQPVARFEYFETNLPVLPAGDVNGDGCVDDADLLSVLFAFGSSDVDADVNEDGVVDDADLLTVLFAFGSGC
jgi:hypothetical protein